MTFKKLEKKNLEDETTSSSEFESLLAESFLESDKQKAMRKQQATSAASAPSPAPAADLAFQVGEVIEGKVVKIEAFGAFIEVAPRIQGLAHISELAWTRVKNPNDILKVGEKVKVKVLRIEQEGNRLKVSLSVKQAGNNDPWQNLPANIQVGQVVTGKVTRCMAFGAFMELIPGVEGLIPLSEMSATKRVQKSDEVVKEGDTAQVLIKNIDTAAKRISLSIKDADGASERASEAQDIRDYKASSKKGFTGESMAAKFQAALDKKK